MTHNRTIAPARAFGIKRKLLASADINSRLVSMGAEVMGGTPQGFGQFLASEIKRHEVIVKDSGAPRK